MWVTTERSYRLTQTPFKSAKKNQCNSCLLLRNEKQLVVCRCCAVFFRVMGIKIDLVSDLFSFDVIKMTNVFNFVCSYKKHAQIDSFDTSKFFRLFCNDLSPLCSCLFNEYFIQDLLSRESCPPFLFITAVA